MISNIIGALLMPHLLAASLLFKIASYEVRPDENATMCESTRVLWCYFKSCWLAWVAHPLYWAGTAIVTAFFLVASLKGIL